MLKKELFIVLSIFAIQEPLLKVLAFMEETRFSFLTVMDNIASHNTITEFFDFWLAFPMIGIGIILFQKSENFWALLVQTIGVYLIGEQLVLHETYDWPYMSKYPHFFSVTIFLFCVPAVLYNLIDFILNSYVSKIINQSSFKMLGDIYIDNVSSQFQKSILVVDDDLDYLNVVKIKLGNEGHLVFTASNGVQALQIANEFRPKIVLTDIDMPIMDGKSLCYLMKESGEINDIPVVAVSAKEFDIDRTYFQEVYNKRNGYLGLISLVKKMLIGEEMPVEYV